jgi:murein L,D-transpeptidase YcbB/YkuD
MARKLTVPILALCVATLAWGAGRAAEIPIGPAAPALSTAERALIVQVLRGDGEFSESSPEGLDDPTLIAAILRHADIELGQRIRPAAVDRFWAIQPMRHEVQMEFAAARRDGRLAAWIQTLSPPDPRYHALAVAACRYRTLVDNGGWAALPPGPQLRAGDQSAQVAQLRARLAIEGYGEGVAPQPDHFDAALGKALAAFQAHHGLPEDGMLGLGTRRELDVSAEERLAQIDANLERWRWLPHDLPADRVEVDVGGAEAVLFKDAAATLRMKAVVGDPRHRTPMFVSKLEAVVFNPPWIVPDSIAQAEILPKAAKDPGYLARHDFAYVEGRLEQLPGPKNALGALKFDLPSPFGVYLHDTPTKSAFARSVRALSHGCMRLEKPRELAVALLGAQGWTSDDVMRAVESRETRRVGLKTSTPLYVLYWTVVIDMAGEAEFRPDVYGWDRKLNNALAGAGGPRAALSREGTECADAPPQGW